MNKVLLIIGLLLLCCCDESYRPVYLGLVEDFQITGASNILSSAYVSVTVSNGMKYSSKLYKDIAVGDSVFMSPWDGVVWK